MKDTDRTGIIDDVATDLTVLASIAKLILDDIHAAEGEPPVPVDRPREEPDVRDPDYEEPEPTVQQPTGPRIADPTPIAALRPDQAKRDLKEIDRRLGNLRSDSRVLLAIFRRHQAARTQAQVDVLRDASDTEERASKLVTKDWCRSHLRVQVLEPVTVRKDKDTGEVAPYYAGMCRSCGDLLARIRKDFPGHISPSAEHPPLELVRIRTYRSLRQSDFWDVLNVPERERRTA